MPDDTKSKAARICEQMRAEHGPRPLGEGARKQAGYPQGKWLVAETQSGQRMRGTAFSSSAKWNPNGTYSLHCMKLTMYSSTKRTTSAEHSMEGRRRRDPQPVGYLAYPSFVRRMNRNSKQDAHSESRPCFPLIKAGRVLKSLNRAHATPAKKRMQEFSYFYFIYFSTSGSGTRRFPRFRVSVIENWFSATYRRRTSEH